ncbi:binding-protein-dependent transport system inner membrane protein [Sesbania bispinosa]|nr:binding-protein-dependent transport system inner membrane protein [Sesbania bispinosa]
MAASSMEVERKQPHDDLGGLDRSSSADGWRSRAASCNREWRSKAHSMTVGRVEAAIWSLRSEKSTRDGGKAVRGLHSGHALPHAAASRGETVTTAVHIRAPRLGVVVKFFYFLELLILAFPLPLSL